MPNPVITRRLPGRQANALLYQLQGSWPLNDATSVLGNGFIHDASGHNWSFSAPNTAIISGAGVGLVTPLADFHTNAAGDPTNVRHFQSADAGLQLGANQQFTVQC